MKKIRIGLGVILLIICCLIASISFAIDNVPETKISVKYEYKKETNTVVVTMTSNNELINNKTTWKLSEDKKQFTYEFDKNTIYNSSVTDIYGRKVYIPLKVIQIDQNPAKVVPTYKYKKETNTVVVTMTSDKKLLNNKTTWKLSEDGKVFTYEFDQNTTYNSSVTDIYGNKIYIPLNVTQIDQSPAKVVPTYKYKKETNTVVVTMTSDKKLLNNKTTWKLSEDGKIFTYEFDENTTYKSSVTDIYGNKIYVPLSVTQINETKIEVKYQYKEDTNTVIVTMTSNNELQNNKTTWKLSADKKIYTYEFDKNTTYTSSVIDKYGKKVYVQINVNQIILGLGQGKYGISGAKVKGINGGSDLEYYKFGYGKNVLFATFCVHGYEDGWDRDGTVLVDIANNFYNRLVNDGDGQLAKKWTIYIFPEVNPDGRRLGTTNNGPGRTTLYSKAEKGIDINRCWQTGNSYQRYTSARNYNGTTGFQAYEAAALRDFLLSHKSKSGKTVVVDLHGWLEQLIGDEEICKYYKQEYTTNKTSYGRYGTQYLIAWARQNLGAKVALVELPEVNSYAEVNSMKLSDKYINATLEMLENE